MTQKMLDSTRPGMTRGSSHLASMYGKDYLELVWENGQILMQGGSSNRTPKTPSCVGYSLNPSRSEDATHEDASITKRTSLSSLYSLLDFPTHRDSHMSSSHQNSHQSNDQDFCQIDLQFSQSKSSTELKEEFENLKAVKDSKLTHGEAHQPPTTGNSHLCTYSSQQCLPSAPLKKPRMDSTQTPATNSKKQYLGCDQRAGKVNFSNFLIPAVFLKSTYQGNSTTQPTRNASSARVVEEIEAGKVKKAPIAASSSKAPDHSVVIESAKGSCGVTGFQEQASFTANKSNHVSLAARSDQETPLDEHSEAVGHNSALRIHGSHGQYYNQTSSSAALRAKVKANPNLCNEPLLASSSVCSLGASNDPNFCIKKHEDTDDSTYLSDYDEEPEDVVKETPTREGNRVKRSRNAEIHNLSERKRRDKINKKMRTLKELIPNCNKIDKASMLDDAIDYLKALKLQLQIMSMGSGLCMPLMMLPTAAHHINGPHLPQLMGAGMGFRPAGTGIPCGPPQFPIPPFPLVTDNRLQMFGFSNQMPPMPIPHAPFIPMIGNSSTQPLMPTSTVNNLAEHLASSAQLTNLEVSVPQNSGLHAKAEYATNQAPNQVSLHHSSG